MEDTYHRETAGLLGTRSEVSKPLDGLLSQLSSGADEQQPCQSSCMFSSIQLSAVSASQLQRAIQQDIGNALQAYVRYRH